MACACGGSAPLAPADAGPPLQLVTDAGTMVPPVADAGPLPDGGLGDGGHGWDGSLITRFPIVLAHGFGVLSTTDAGTDNAQTFFAVQSALEADGQTVVADDAAAYDSVANRAASLLSTATALAARTHAAQVNIIAHSMGGLDARYLASPGGLARGDLVASISTISTPHRGTAMADLALGASSNALVGPFVQSMTQAFGNLDLTDPKVVAALNDLSEAYSPTFNAATPDDPRVYYQSWAGVATVGGFADSEIGPTCDGMELPSTTVYSSLDLSLVPLSPVVAHGTDEWRNDGVVAVESSIYDNFRGCLAGDHFHVMGATDTAPLAIPDPQTGFNYVQFYLDLVHDLAQRGY